MNYKVSLLLLGLLFAVVLSLSSATEKAEDEQDLAAAEETNQGGGYGYIPTCRIHCCAHRGSLCTNWCCRAREEVSQMDNEAKQLNNDQEASFANDEFQPDGHGDGNGGGYGGGRGGDGGAQEDNTKTKPQN